VLCCDGFTSGEDIPVAIQIIGKPDSIHVGDTVVLNVRVLNRSGDSIPGAPTALISLNPDTLGIDSARQAVVGKIVGTGRLVARSGGFPSAPFTILVK
jgi:hypothetical protein